MICFGKNLLTNKKLFVPLSRFGTTHTHVLGSPGVGKSKLLEQIAQDIIQSGHGLIVLDGKGDLYDSLLKWCVSMKYPSHRLTLIDPRDPHAPSINILEPLGHTDPSTQAEIVIEAIQKMHGNEETRVTLEEWGEACLTPLNHGRLCHYRS